MSSVNGGAATGDAIAFGEKLLALLDTGSFTTSYKYAVLLALVDEVLENSGVDGAPPRVVHGRAIGRRVFDLYWSQARPFSEAGPLRQSRLRDLTVKLSELRDQLGVAEYMTVHEAARRHPDEIAKARHAVEVVVLRYPIPRLQRLGDGKHAVEDRFIYDYGWDTSVAVGALRSENFDDRLHLVGRVGSHLIALAGLIRPVVQREWMAHVARRNEDQLDDFRLERYLFGSERVDLTRLARPLRQLQGGSCFYCGRTRGPWEVDHFLPRSRWNDDSLDNLVVADRSCNNAKRAALPGLRHLERWWVRQQRGTAVDDKMTEMAEAAGWYRRPEAAVSVATALYLRQPPGMALWTPGDVELLDPAHVRRVLRMGRHVAEAAEGRPQYG